MLTLPLIAVPSQSFTFRDNDARWVIDLHDCGDVMSVTITRDDVLVVSGMRALPGEFLIPFEYLETGNFLFLTEGDQLPSGPLLADTQTLVYLTVAEMREIRNG